MSGIARKLVSSAKYDSAWNIPAASFFQSFSVADRDGNPTAVSFKPDGFKMFFLGRSGRRIYEYNLSIAWDISTASFFQQRSVIAQETSPQGMFFTPDGTRVYVTGNASQSVHEYSLSSAWDISTISHIQSFGVAAQETFPEGVFLKPDGTKMFTIGSSSRNVDEYSLSTPWDTNTASYIQSKSGLEDTAPSDLFFKPDGDRMYIIGRGDKRVREFRLSIPWDISTAYSFGRYFDVGSQDARPSGLFFREDGKKFYITGFGNDNVYEYNI